VKIFITGGTGFFGSILTEALSKRGHHITVLTRTLKQQHSALQGMTFLEGDPTHPGAWQDRVTEHETIINLAGATIFCHWNKKAKERIRNSRILSTQNLVNSFRKLRGETTALLSASAVGFYGFRGEERVDENSPSGEDFLAALCADWEKEAEKARDFGVRVTLCRFGIILGGKGGALALMRKVFSSYLGSRLGNGKQWFSWIHEQDLARIFLYLLEEKQLEGPINCTSPHPVRNKELTRSMSKVLGRPVILPPVPGFVLRVMLGEFAQTLLKGQRVVPRRLLEEGFPYQFPHLEDAIKNILSPGNS
jgi:uncharacterized protein (TIGR01777 family)